MKNQPLENSQPRFKETPESIKVGDILKYHSEDGGYFTNQFGFRIDTIPVKARVKVYPASSPLNYIGDNKQLEGVILFKDGKTLFNLESKMHSASPVHYQESKFFNGDGIEIIGLL
ncbi:MAG TPA: hypothetical protein VGO63_01645 [Candidatus Paceibacterota bacterium]|jgi:hypothetical protein|nr:hypothetical protein [Candidatus Paceibacterota bacterium]